MAIAPVVIEFLAKGIPQVQQAFKSVQDAAIRAEKAQTGEAAQAGRTRVASAQKEAREKIAAYKFADREHSKAIKQGIRETEKAAKEEAKATRDAAREKIAAYKFADREHSKALRQGVKEAERAAKDEVKAAKDAAKERVAASKAADKAIAKARAQEQDQSLRDARQGTHESNRVNRARGRVAEAVLGAGTRGVVAGLQRAGNVAMGLSTTAANVFGGFSLADAVSGEQGFRKQAAGISARTILSGAGPNSKNGRAYSTSEVLSKAKGIGIERNLDPADVLQGIDRMAKLTGNLESSMNAVDSVAKISKANGSDLSITTGLAAEIFSANPGIKQEALNNQLRLFTKQSVVGGVETEDFARYGARITASASKFGGNIEKNEGVLGAMAQMARQYGGASSASEATKGSERFASAVGQKADKLRKLGVEVSDGNGTLKDPETIILDMLRKTKGDVTKLSEMGLGERGERPLAGVAALYRKNGGGEKGLDAVREEFKKYTTGVTEDEVNAAYKRVMAEEQVEQSLRKLKITAGEQLLPVLAQMIDPLKQLIPALVDAAKVGIPAFTELMQTVSDFVTANEGIISSLAAHPVGALIALEVIKSFAAAGLPAILRGLFSGALGGGGGAGGAAGGVMGGLGRAAPGLARGLGATAMVAGAAALGDSLAGGQKAWADGTMDAENMAARVRAWGRGERDPARSMSPAAAMQARQDALGRLADGGALSNLGNGIAGVFSDTAEKKYNQAKADEGLIDSKDLKKAIEEAAAAGIREGVATGMKAWSASNTGTNGAGRWHSMLDR